MLCGVTGCDLSPEIPTAVVGGFAPVSDDDTAESECADGIDTDTADAYPESCPIASRDRRLYYYSTPATAQ